MQKLKQIYEGKAKKVYGTDDPELYIVDYKDDATAFNGLKKGTIAGKGVINNRMSNLLMQMLEKRFWLILMQCQIIFCLWRKMARKKFV